MSSEVVLHGYSASSYVFSVRILLAAKGIRHELVPVDVLAGGPRSEAHRRLHPFGKVPVLEHDDLRIVETSAIMRYVNDAFEGPSCIPGNARDRARMDMAIGLYDSYGYGAMARVTGYHRFPDFVGNPTRADVDASLAQLHTLFEQLMKVRAESAFLAGEQPSLADHFVAPACFYLDLVDETAALSELPGLGEWWGRVQQLDEYRAAVPDLRNWGER